MIIIVNNVPINVPRNIADADLHVFYDWINEKADSGSLNKYLVYGYTDEENKTERLKFDLVDLNKSIISKSCYAEYYKLKNELEIKYQDGSDLSMEDFLQLYDLHKKWDMIRKLEGL